MDNRIFNHDPRFGFTT